MCEDVWSSREILKRWRWAFSSSRDSEYIGWEGRGNRCLQTECIKEGGKRCHVNHLMWNEKENSRGKKAQYCEDQLMLLFSWIVFFIHNRVDGCGVSREPIRRCGWWFALNLVGLLSRGCWISWTIAGYSSWLCYNNPWNESRAPGGQTGAFYLISGLCPVFFILFTAWSEQMKKERSAGVLAVL